MFGAASSAPSFGSLAQGTENKPLFGGAAATGGGLFGQSSGTTTGFGALAQQQPQQGSLFSAFGNAQQQPQQGFGSQPGG